jgi:undecaprenyl-diphosphatase
MMAWRVAPGAAFVALLVLVAGGWAPLYAADRAVSARALASGRDHPAWVTTMRLVTDAGATVTFLAAGVALAVVLFLLREYGSAAATALVVALVPVLWGVQHEFLHRPRPVGGFVAVESNGFPSGHTAHATALALLVVFLVWGRRGWPITVICAVLFAALIGVSRVALLAHWPSDVVGGWLLGLAVVPLVMWAVPGALRSRAPTPAGTPPGPGRSPG